MAVVESGEAGDAQPLGDDHERRVGAAEAQVGVLVNQLTPQPCWDSVGMKGSSAECQRGIGVYAN